MKNTVELLGTYGSDETHAQSAWTSTTRDIEAKRDRIPDLLKMLAENGHHTPFEKSSLHFLVRTDVATHIHLLKHRIGVSVNAESARYKELKEPDMLLPSDWSEGMQYSLIMHYQNSLALYKNAIGRLMLEGHSRQRAKESARFFLPYANQITADVMFNFRSFMHFIQLRDDDHAQKETHDLAEAMLELVRGTGQFEHSLAAFGLSASGGM